MLLFFYQMKSYQRLCYLLGPLPTALFSLGAAIVVTTSIYLSCFAIETDIEHFYGARLSGCVFVCRSLGVPLILSPCVCVCVDLLSVFLCVYVCVCPCVLECVRER